MTRAACVIVFCFGNLALAAWLWDVAALETIRLSQPAMMPLTALSLVVASLSLWLLRDEKQPIQCVAGSVGAMIVLLAGTLILAEHLLHWDAGIDRLLFAERLAVGATPGRPSYHTAFSLIFLGAALLVIDVQTVNRHRPAQLLSLIGGLATALALEGHIIGFTPFYKSSTGLGIGVPTAGAFLILAIGIFLARPGGLLPVLASTDSAGVISRLLLPSPFVVGFVLAWMAMAGGRAQLYDRAVGTWLLQLANLVIFTTLIWFTTSKLYRSDLERRLALTALQESEQRFRKVFEDGPLGMAMVSADGHFLRANPALTRMTGYSREDLSDMRLRDLSHPDDAGMEVELVERLLGGEVPDCSTEQRYLTKDQGVVWVQRRSCVVRDILGVPLYQLAIIEDISERRRSQEALEHQTTQLRIANSELEAFSYSVSHDLRAPLRAIQGFSEILLKDCAPQLAPDAQRYLHRVATAAHTMGCLIDDLLRFSHLSRQPLNQRPVSTSSMVHDVIRELHVADGSRPVELVIGEIPDCVADPPLLKQVFVNLIANAVKFTRDRKPARIEIGSTAPDSEPVYFVKDNGVGFDMLDAQKLFGAFERLHSQHDYPGTGVGLAIVQRIVQRHGGRVWAEAAPGKGAVFSFTLHHARTDVSAQTN